MDSAAAPSRLRVCHLAYTFYETDNRVLRYAREMAMQGHDVDVIALRRNGEPAFGSSDGVRVFRIQRRSVTETRAITYLAKLVWFLVKATVVLTYLHARRRYDIVHVHNVPDFLIFAAVVPKLTGARLILDIHDILPELYAGKFGAGERSRGYRLLLGIERASCAFADHVIVANDLWHQTLVGRSAKYCTTILNYPDMSLFRPFRADRSSDRPFTFLYPGSLNHHQGVDLAVTAFSLMKDAMPDAELHVYGEGPMKPGLVALLRELGLEHRIKIRDRISLSEMAAVIAAADVGVVPKRADGFGNEAFSTKIFEFMACGVPVVVARTRVDDHHFDGTLVRFFTPGDARDLAAAMLDTFQNRAAASARAANARTFAVRNSWQERRNEYHQLIASLMRPEWSRQIA